MCLNSFLKQEKHLNEIMSELEQESAAPRLVNKLSQLRTELLKDKHIRFYMCADLERLRQSQQRPMDAVWLEQFPRTLALNGSPLFVSNRPFEVDFTWKMKKASGASVNTASSQSPSSPTSSPSSSASANSVRLHTPASKRDFVINLGSTESSFLRIVASTDIDSYKHPNYPALLVLIEYFTQTEVS